MDHSEIDDWNESETKTKKINKRRKNLDEYDNDGIKKLKKYKKRSHRKNTPKDKLWEELMRRDR